MTTLFKIDTSKLKNFVDSLDSTLLQHETIMTQKYDFDFRSEEPKEASLSNFRWSKLIGKMPYRAQPFSQIDVTEGLIPFETLALT